MRNHPPEPPPGAAAKSSSLTISKVVAGAGAAATTAVVGSVFGADGTVVGAAVGSVVSAVAAAGYERSFDTTRKMVTTRVRRGGQDVEITQVMPTEAFDPEATQVIPAQRAAAAEVRDTGSIAPAVRPRRTRWPVYAGAGVVIFVVGMLLVTGLEFFTGGPVLSSSKQGGTSVGTLLKEGPGAASAPSTEEATPTASATDAAEPSASASASSTKRSDSDARPSGRARASSSAGPSATPAPRGLNLPAPPTDLPGAQQDG